MKKGFILIITMIFLMGCVSSKRFYKSECLDSDRKFASFKNVRKTDSLYLLAKVVLDSSVGMANSDSLDQEMQVSEEEFSECERYD